MSATLVSTIIPVYNRPRLLAEAINSVLAQTHRPIEIIIVDDGSTDNTPQVAERLRAIHPDSIRLIRQANGGPGCARQAGLNLARGSFIQFLDSDDLLLPNKFALQVDALTKNFDAEIAYGPSYEEVHLDGAPRCDGPMRGTGTPQSHLFPRLLNERWWTTSSPLYRRRLLDRIGPIQPWINEEDWEYDARCAAEGTALVYTNAVLSLRRLFVDGDHLSSHGSSNPLKLSHRALAQQSIFQCALKAGVTLAAPEMKRFSRSAFLLSRQCAEAGLENEAVSLHHLACSACERDCVPFDLRLYAWLARQVGWQRAALTSKLLRRIMAIPARLQRSS